MNTRKTVTAFILLFSVYIFSPTAQAQRRSDNESDLGYTLSSMFEVPKGNEFSQFIETPDALFAVFVKGDDEYSGFRIDESTMDIEPIGKLTIEKSKDRHHFIVLGNKVYHPYFQSSKEEKTNCLFIREMDMKTMQPKGEPVSVDCLQGDDYYRDFDNSFAATKISPDGTKLAVYYKLPEPEEGKLFRFVVYDSGLQEIWRKDVATKIDQGILKVGGADWFMAAKNMGVVRVYDSSNHYAIALDNNGNIFFWSRVDFGRDKKKYQRFQTFFSKVNGTKTEHLHMERTHGTQSLRSFKPTLHVSDTRTTLVEMYANEGRGGYAFMVASTENAADGFHYAQWREDAKPLNFYAHPFSLAEIAVPASHGIYRKLRKKERTDKGIMLQPYGYNMYHVSGTDHLYLRISQGIHRRYSTTSAVSAALTYHLNENEELTYLGGFPYHQGEHLGNYDYLGLSHIPTSKGLYYVFNDNRRNLKNSFSPLDDVYPFFTAANPVAVVPALLDKDSPENGKRKKILSSKELGDLPFDISNSYTTRDGELLNVFRDEEKFGFFRAELKE